MRRLADLFKGLVATAAALALLVAVPIALATFIGWPIDNLASVFTDDLMSDNTKVEILLRYGLGAIAWFAWAQLAWALIAETLAVARGRVASRVPVFPGIQLMARKLVAAATLIVTVFTASPVAAGSLAPLSTPAPALEYTATSAVGYQTETQPTVDRAPEAQTITVGPSDTFWSLSEQLLDDGLRWKELRVANLGRTMPDGTVISEVTEEIRPGWVLVLPSDAVIPLATDARYAPAAQADEPATENEEIEPQDPVAPDVAEGEVRVFDGDHFWSISEQILTQQWGRAPSDAELTPFWAEMVALNDGRLLPPGDPNLIYPGQDLVVPPIPPSPNGSAPSAVPTGESIMGDGDNVVLNDPPVPGPDAESELPVPPVAEPAAPAADADTPVVTEESAVEQTVPDEPAAGEVPVEESAAAVMPAVPPRFNPADGEVVANEPVPVPTDELIPTDEESETEPESSSGIPLPVAVAAISGVGLAAASIWRVISRRRAQALGERRPGTRPMFNPPNGAEALLNRTADDRGLTDLDQALRALGASLGEDIAMPELVGVMMTAETIKLLLDSAHNAPPAPFVATEGGTVWILDRTADLGAEAVGAEAPFPTLVSVGHTDRSQLLVDLEQAGVVNVSGTQTDITDTMATMALELATTPVADTIEILCVGFGHELADLDRITVAANLDEAAHRISVHAADVASVAANAELIGPAGRAAGEGGESWTPLVVFDPTTDDPARLVTAAAETLRAGVTAVVTSALRSEWQLEVANGQIKVPALGVTRSRRNLSLDERTSLVATIADAKAPEMVETPDLAADILATSAAHTDSPSPDEVPGDSSSSVVDLWDTATPGDRGAPEPVADPDGDDTADIDLVSPTPPTFPPPPPRAPARPPDWDAEVVIRVLGPLTVERRDGESVQFTRSLTPEFLAYLAQHRHGVDSDTLLEALWPGDEPKKSRIHNLSTDARKVLGDDSGGEPYVPRGDPIYRISPLVGSDLERFEQLVAYAGNIPVAAAVPALRDALGYVTGMPYSGLGSNWHMMKGIFTQATLAVDEAARTAAQLALDELDDPAEAEWATSQGLLANPRSTELHLLRLRAALARENDELAPEAVFQQYRTIMLGDDDHPEGASQLDSRIVALYESFRRTQPANWAEATTG